jgi:virulence-associated protein VapD
MDELPADIVERLEKLPAGLREEYFKDCLQETRFSSFQSSLYLIREIKDLEKFKEIQEKYSRFLVFTAREWFLSIPQIQNLQNPVLQEYLRLVLSEMLSKNLIQGTDGWCYVTKHALLLWPISPICCENHLDIYLAEDGGRECCYCEKLQPCMAKDKTRKCHKKAFCCFLEGGVHLCKHHAKRVFKDDTDKSLINDRIELDDGRVMWTLKNADFMDVTNMQVDSGPKYVSFNDFGEYEIKAKPIIKKEEEKGATEDTLLRVREEIVALQPKDSFWDVI